MSNKHQIDSSVILDILKTETNGKGGMFTIKSIKTEKEYTYKINRTFFKDKWYSHIFVETNYLDFTYLGSYSNGVITNKKIVNISPSAIAIGYILNCLEKGLFDYVNERTEFYHLGKCIKCGKTLTDTNSIKLGLGPTCSKNINNGYK